MYERIKIIDNLNQININKISFEDYKKEIIINNLLLSNNRLKIIKIKCGINDIQLNANIKDGLFIIYKSSSIPKSYSLKGIAEYLHSYSTLIHFLYQFCIKI